MTLLKQIVFITFITVVSCEFCPKKCDCDIKDGLNRAVCVDQSIININVGVPQIVQIYILSHNVISELDNYSFKEAGYRSIEILDLSYNLIFWIGLYAFDGLDKLVHLDLSNNRLRDVPYMFLHTSPLVHTLDLSSNIFENLKNEPFLMHDKLEILNLNNCRIRSVPNRLFSRLPNLRKLDLSENYMITIGIEVFRPLRRLERLGLRNDYLQCTPDFLAVETWIISRSIAYSKQCRKKLPQMSEKIIAVLTEKPIVEIEKVWNMTINEKNETLPSLTTERPLTPFEKLDKEFSSVQAFIIGIEIGLAAGILGTYLWLRSFCKCGQLGCSRRKPRRRRNQRIGDSDQRANLLWSTIINPDLDTPPIFRRQLSLPDGSTPPFPTYGLPGIREAGLQVDAIRIPANRAETPPPPYNDCRINI